MKKTALLIGLLLISTANAQSILNGGLEPEGWPECVYYSTPPPPPEDILEDLALQCAGGVQGYIVSDCFPFIKVKEYGVLAVFHENCLYSIEGFQESIGVSPTEGEYYFGIASINDTLYNEFSMELSEPLINGDWYKLSYDVISTSLFAEAIDSAANEFDSVKVEIGLSNGELTFGQSIHFSDLPTPEWVTQSVVFQANSDTINYITCRTVNTGVNQNALHIDNFVLSTDTTSVGIGGQAASKPRQLLRIIDVLGRETQPKPNTPLFYLYDDGTVEKRMLLKTSN